MGTLHETSPKQWVRGRLLGTGTFGTVTLAIDKSNGELFAVKSMASDLVSCLENEYSILRSLDSPYVVRCLGRDYTLENGAGVCHLMMEYMPGGSVADLVAKFGGQLEESVIRAYTRCILRGLKYLHGQGIVHCDVKAKNVLVGTGGIKLADFGSAKRISEKGTDIKDRFQLRGRRYGWRPKWLCRWSRDALPISGHWAAQCWRWPHGGRLGATFRIPWPPCTASVVRTNCRRSLKFFSPKGGILWRNALLEIRRRGGVLKSC